MKALSGMKEICGHMRRSESTMLALIRDFDFPAKKIRGIWESHTDLIDEWLKMQIAGKPDILVDLVNDTDSKQSTSC